MSKFFIDRPVFATVIAILIVLAGVLAIRILPVAQYPQITPPTISVTISYPGANAETVARSVGVPIEQEISGVDNLLYFSSTSTNDGTYTLTCTFEIGTNIDQAQVQVQNRTRRAEPRLPAESLRRGIVVDKVNTDILCVAFLKSADPRYDATYLANYATINVRDALRRLPGVGDATVFGNRDYAMRIWVNPDRMAQRQLTITDVASAIREQNAIFSAGRIGQAPSPEGTELTVPVIATGRYSTPEEFERIIVRSNPDGSQVLLTDIARVELGSESYDQQNRLNGIPSAGILVYLRPGANALDTVSDIRRTMSELQAVFPQGVEWEIPFDTTRFVRVSIREVVKTLFEAALLVAVVVFVFLQSWRATLIPLIAVPVSIVGTFAGLHVLGFSINTLTLFGLVLAIGIVVDDAIIVVENVERILESEPDISIRDATIKAMEQVTGPVVAVVLVLAAVFVPVMFIGGLTGQLYKQFAVTVTVSVALSGLIALTLTPALCRLLLKRRHPPKRGPFAWFNSAFSAATRAYGFGVRNAIRFGVLTVLIFGAMVFGTWSLFQRVPSGFLPTEDQGYIITAMSLPQGASVARTSDVVRKVEEYYLAQEEVENVVSLSGFDFIAGRIAATNGAVLFTPLKDWSLRPQPNQSADALMGRARAGLGSINQSLIVPVNPPPIQGLGVSAGIEFQLQAAPGATVQQLHKVVLDLQGRMMQRKDLYAIVIQPQSVSVPQLLAKPDTTRAKSLGIGINQIYDSMQAMFGALYVNDFERLGRVWRVQLQAEPEFRSTPEGLSRIFVRNNYSGMVPLSAIVDTSFTAGPNAVFRFNGRNAVQFTVPLIPGRSSGDALETVQEIAKEVLPPGYSVQWSGVSYQEVKAGNQAPILMVFGLVVVFLVLAAQYENWVLPIAVLLAVPFGALGAYAAVHLRGIPADIYFQIGLLVLIGLVAKNAILIVEFCVIQRREGKSLRDAAVEAAIERLRPILMTSFAFILGVLPLVIATGAGANARNSIGTGVMGGMIVASTLALLFVPLFFVILQWCSEKLFGQRHFKHHPAPTTSPTPTPAHPTPAHPASPSTPG
jgi:hydrophobe/amphiphile efflux-1 (HAE1) family protein